MKYGNANASNLLSKLWRRAGVERADYGLESVMCSCMAECKLCDFDCSPLSFSIFDAWE